MFTLLIRDIVVDVKNGWGQVRVPGKKLL